MQKWERDIINLNDNCSLSGYIQYCNDDDSYNSNTDLRYNLKLRTSIGYNHEIIISLWEGLPNQDGKELVTCIKKTIDNPSVLYETGIFHRDITDKDLYLVIACTKELDLDWINPVYENGYYAYAYSIAKSKYINHDLVKLDLFTSPTANSIRVTPTIDTKLVYYAMYNDPESKYQIAIRCNNEMQYVSNGSTAVFNNLESGKEYNIEAIIYDSYANEFTTSTNETTYNIKINILSRTPSLLTASIDINNDYNGDILYWTNKDNTKKISTSNILSLPVEDDVILYAEIPEIEDSAQYIQSYLVNKYNEVNINSTTTFTSDSNTNETKVFISGTTITVMPTFSGEIQNFYWDITCEEKTIMGKAGDYAKFDNLTNGTLYELKLSIDYIDPNNSDNNFNEVYTYYAKTYGCEIDQIDPSTNGCRVITKNFLAQFGIDPDDMITLEDKDLSATIAQIIIDNEDKEDILEYNIDNDMGIDKNVINVTLLEPLTKYRLYIYMKECVNYYNENDSIIYIDFETQDTIAAEDFVTEVTGKTVCIFPRISDWKGSHKLFYNATIYEGTNIGSQAVDIINGECDQSSILTSYVRSTKLKTGTKYHIEIIGYDDNENYIKINPIDIQTYGLKLGTGDRHTTFISEWKVEYKDGLKNDNISQNPSLAASAVKWFIAPADDITNIIIGPNIVDCSLNDFGYGYIDCEKLLEPGKGYILYAYVEGISYEGNNDTVVNTTFNTYNPAKDVSATFKTTGTTIECVFDWIDSSSKDYVLTASCTVLDGLIDLDLKSTTIKGNKIVFTGLEKGKDYTCVITASDNEGNNTSNRINIKGASSRIITTYKISIDNVEYSTRGVKWKCNGNKDLNDDSILEYHISQGDPLVIWRAMRLGDEKRYTELAHGTHTKLQVRIKDMINIDGINDTVEEYEFSTKLLTVALVHQEQGYRDVETYWQAYANGVNYDSDPIANTFIQFVLEKTSCKNAKTDIPLGTWEGTYNPDKFILFSNLDVYSEYFITVTISDGYNESRSVIYSIYTQIPLIRIYDERSGKFKKALPYIYTNGKFEKTSIFIYHNNKWRNTTSE